MQVSRIYRAIQPVGFLAGAPVVTVEFFGGCPVGCCLSPDEQYPDVGAEVILSQIAKLDSRANLIRLSGNDPMRQPGHDLFSLLESLRMSYGKNSRSIILETCGACSLETLRSGLCFDGVSIYLFPRMAHSDRRRVNRLESWAMLRSSLGDCILMMCMNERDIEMALEDLRKAVEGFAFSDVPVYFYLDSAEDRFNANTAEWFVHFIPEFRKLKIDARLGVKINYVPEQFARDKIKPGSPSVFTGRTGKRVRQ